MIRRQTLSVVLACAAIALLPAASAAQAAYPSRSVALIVAEGAGEGLDAAARAYAEALQTSLGQAIVLVTAPGEPAAGLARLHDAAPDGYSLGMVGSFAVVSALGSDVRFGPQRLSYLAHLGRDTFLLAVPSRSPHRTLRDYLATGAGGVSPVAIGTGGPGTLSPVAAASIAQIAAVNLAISPFAGPGGVLKALADNRVAAGILVQSDLDAHAAHGGGPRPIATFGDVRSPRFPGVATAAEQNLSGVPAGPWIGIGAPPGLPEPVRKTLVAAMARAAEDPRWKAFVQRQGLAGSFMSGDVLNRFVDGEVESLRVTMQSLGLLAR